MWHKYLWHFHNLLPFCVRCFAAFHKRSVSRNCSLCRQILKMWSKPCLRSQLIQQPMCMCVCFVSCNLCIQKRRNVLLFNEINQKHKRANIDFIFPFHFVSPFFKLLHKWLEFIWFDRSLIFKASVRTHQIKSNRIKRSNLELVFNFSNDKRTTSNAHIE